MSLLQQALEVFVTYIENEGPLLRLWAQLERTQATFVERLILQLSEQFERGLGIPSSVEVGQLCCARYSDGVYYRARVTRPADMSLGKVSVHFIDYGNSEVVSVRDIRSLEQNLLTPLASVSDQATEFFLAGVIPLAGSWDETSLTFIRQTICYEELKSVVVGQVASKRLLKVFYNNEDFAQILIARKIGVAITPHAQQILLQGYYGLNSVPPHFPGFTVPPPPRMLTNHLHGQTVSMAPVSPIQMESNPHVGLGSAPSVRETVRVFTSPVLELTSEHMVYVSFVEDGPSSFAIQLQAAEGMLSTVMDELNNVPAIPLTQPLMPGSVCLGRFTEDQTLCRAVVMAVLNDKCRLYYVDFGNSEILPYSQIFELPQRFINPKVMALRFALAGLKNLTISDDIKSYFKELVTEKLLRLRVMPPDGPPLKQYGELYLNGTNVLELILQKIKEKQVPLNFPVMPIPPIGTNGLVKVSYVISMSNFYIQLEANTEALKSVMLAIEATCSGAAAFLEVGQLRVGLPCCAQYSEDEKWYRAKVLSVSSSLVEVMYVDYGNTDSVPLSSLKCIDPSLVKILNMQAVPCCLSGFQDNVDEELATKFEEITLDKSLTMVVLDKLPNSSMLVELYDSSSGSHVNIGAQLLANRAVPETARTEDRVENQFTYNSSTEDSGWQEAATEASLEMSHRGIQHKRKQQTWGGGANESNQRESSRADENVNEWRSRDGGGKPWQNKDSSNWRQQENGDRGARGKWSGRGDGERGGKWNSRGDDERRGKSWQDNATGSNSGNDGDFKKKSWNRDEDGGNRSGGSRNNDEGSGRRKKWNDNEDDGGRRNRRRDDDVDDSWRGGGNSSSKWRSNRTDDGDGSTGSRGHKPWGNREQSEKSFGRQQNSQNENVKTKTWGGNMEAATRSWDDNDIDVTVAGSIPESAVRIGDVKLVDVVFTASPAEFCVQVSSESAKLTSIMERIAATYGSGSGNTVPSANLKAGTACVAHYSEDGIMYRAIIETVTSSSAVVLFCDYGNREEVPLDEMKEISPEYCSLPVQGLVCRLLAAKPQQGVSWSEDEINKFTSLTEEKKLQAKFVNRSNGVYEVVLEDIEAGININEQLGVTAEQVQAVGFKPSVSLSFELASPDQRFLVPTVAPESEDEVTITWFINPEHFYCHSVTSQSAISDMMNTIQSAYLTKTPLNSSVQVGSPVIAKFLSDGVLYRAEVKEVPDASSLIVQFVDYGNCDLVARSNVWDIETRFMSLPKQALPCCLRGVKSPDSQWSRKDAGVDKYFEAEKFHCTFHNCDQDKYSVSLMSVEGKNIADQLLADGLGIAQVIHSRTMKTADIGEESLDLSLLPGQIVAAHVTYVEGIAKFFVHLNPALANRIQALVDDHVLTPENVQPIGTDSLVVDSLCIATPDSAQWYRGKIIDCTRTTGVFIQFIDFGDGDEIPLDKVLVIPPELAQHASQAVECCIVGSDSATIVPEVEDKFKADFEDTDVILRVDSVYEGRLCVTIFSMDGKRLQVLRDVDQGQLSEVDPVCPFPVTSKKTKVWVSHVDGPYCLWLQRVHDADAMADLLEKMYVFYEIEGKGVELEASKDKLCAAKSANDEQWYRGKVLSVNNGDETCTVLFIDYGNSETIPATHVKELDASLFTPHAQAVSTALVVELDQNKQITSELLEITTDKEFTAVFGLKKENKWLIDLFVEGESVSKKLLHLGLVKDFKADLFPSELTRECLKKGTSCPVFVSHINSPCDFWVQKEEDSQAILTMQEKLQVAADILENVTLPPPAGTKCIGMFAEVWYRAVVLESNSTSVTVHFIDYGNVEVIDVASEGLKPLPEALQDIPEYAERCSLLEACEFKVDDKAADKMEALVEGAALMAHVLSEKEIKHVDLHLANGISILEVLTSEGLVTKPRVAEVVSAIGTETKKVSVLDTEAIEEVSTVDTEAKEDVSGVFVSYVKSPSEFWIQYESDTSQIEEMENRMLEAENFSVLDEIVEGALCAAEFTDGQWYRAKVLQVTGEGIHVFFLDYGNLSVSTELRNLPEDLTGVPPLAKHCSLCLPDGVTEWSLAAKMRFIEKAENSSTQFQVNILEEGDCAVVSLLEGGQNIEELSILCPIADEAPTKLRACVSHVTSPCEFWIQFESSSSQLDEISSQLAESEGFPILNVIEESALCTAQFSEDGSWYRAQILSHDDKSSEVVFVDFGNTAISTELRELPRELRTVPPLAKKCSLFIPNDISEWPETVKDAFMDILGDITKLFEIEIIKDGDPAVVSMCVHGKKIEEELFKIVETKNKEIAGVESEICPEEEKEETEDLSQNDDFEPALEEVKDEYVKTSGGANEVDMSEKQNNGFEEKTQDEMEEKEENIANNIGGQGEVGTEHQDGEMQLAETVILERLQNIHDAKEEEIDVTPCIEESMSAENTKIKSAKESTKDVTLDSLNSCAIIKTDDGNGKGKLALEDVVARPPEIHLQKTEHTERLVKEISIEMKTPDDVVSKTSVKCKDLYSERIVPASISRGLSEEELLTSLMKRSASPKLAHDEKIVPGSISHSRLADINKDGEIKSAPSTPLVSRSDRILQRAASHDELRQSTTPNPKLIHNDRIVPGSISRGESQEEIRPSTPKLPHAEKIVPGSISRGVSDETLFILATNQLQSATGAPEVNGEGATDVTPCQSLTLKCDSTSMPQEVAPTSVAEEVTTSNIEVQP